MAKTPNEKPAPNAENVTDKVTEKVNAGQVRTITQKAKLTLSDFRPKRLHSDENKDVQRLLVGTLIGRANGVIERTGADGETKFPGLSGVFEAHVTGSEPVRSGVLFMPESFQEPLIKMLSDEVDEKTGEIITPGATAIKVAYRVFVARANNPAGYSWELDQIIDDNQIAENDPLADIRGLIGGGNTAQKALPAS